MTDIANIQKLNNNTQKQITKVEVKGKRYELPRGVQNGVMKTERTIVEPSVVNSVWMEF